MSRPVLFKDIGKRLSDLLTKEFPSEKQETKIEWKGKSSGGVTIETNFTANYDGSVVGQFKPSTNLKDLGGASLTLDLNTKREFKTELAIENKVVDGLKLTVAANTKPFENWATVGFEYKHNLFNLTANVNAGETKGTSLKASAVAGTTTANGRVDVGGEVEYLHGESIKAPVQSFNSKASYSASDLDGSLFVKVCPPKNITEVGLSYFHKVNNDLVVGAEASFDPINTDSKPKLTMGWQYLYQDSVLKTKFDTTGQLGLSLSHKLNSYTKATLSTTLDSYKLNEKNNAKYGVTISFSQ